jgi:hypothetical protein
MLRRLVFTLALALGAAAALLPSLPAYAQFRSIPADAKRATLNQIQGATATINGKNVQMAVGLQIRDGRNMIVVPTAVPANLVVKYLLDGQGQVFRLWILSPAEAAQPDPK